MLQRWLSPVLIKKSFGNRSLAVNQLINSVQAIPNAVIAGGALRDMYFGKQAKDLDIWCLNDMSAKRLYERLRDGMPDTFREHKLEKFENVYEGMRVDAVRKVTLNNGLQIDIIETGNEERDGFEIALNFDLNINQFWLHGRDIRSPLNRGKGVVRVTGNQVPDERQVERIKKFMDKYPEFDWMPFAHEQAEPFRGQLLGHKVNAILENRGDWVQQARRAINPFRDARVEPARVIVDDWN